MTQISPILPPKSQTPSLGLHKRPSDISGVWGWLCPICSLSQNQAASTQSAHKIGDVTCTEQIEQFYPVVSLQKWHEIAWTLTADTVLAPASLLHSHVHFLFQSMHDQGVPRFAHFQHLLTSTKPFVRCSNHHYTVSLHQNDLRGSPVCDGNELGTVQNKNPSLSDLRLCPNCLSQKCRRVAVGFLPW